MASIEISRLTKQLAMENKDRIAELFNRIPLIGYTSEDVVSEVSNHNKPLTGKWDQSLVAVEKGQIVGVLVSYVKQVTPPYYPVDSCYLSELAVASEWEGQGIARRLTEQWLAETAELSPHSLQTNSADSNAHVINFYKSFGFSEVSRKQYDNRLDLVMFKY